MEQEADIHTLFDLLLVRAGLGKDHPSAFHEWKARPATPGLDQLTFKARVINF